MLLTRKAEFSASHVCRNPALGEDENRALYGANANPHGHGHNYVLEVTIEGDPDPVTAGVGPPATMPTEVDPAPS